MGTQQTPRQRKIAAALQKELSTMLQEAVREQGVSNLVVSITKVYVTIDLSLAKIFLSIFPKNKAKKYLNGIQENAFQINCDLASRMRNQLRRMPKFYFYIDDSLDYVEEIENALKKSQNSIHKTEFLSEKQKNKWKNRVSQEIKLAMDVQKRLMPKRDMDHFPIFGLNIPAREISGDFYDFFLHDDEIYFTLSDVSGKGVNAGMVMAKAITLFKIYSKNNTANKSILALNKLNLEVKQGEIFGLLGPDGAGKTSLMKEIANHVKDGAMAYLNRQYKIVSIVFAVILLVEFYL